MLIPEFGREMGFPGRRNSTLKGPGMKKQNGWANMANSRRSEGRKHVGEGPAIMAKMNRAGIWKGIMCKQKSLH